VDADGVVQAANPLAREYLGLARDPRGRSAEEVFSAENLEKLRTTAFGLAADDDASSADVEVTRGDVRLRLQVTVHKLADPAGTPIGVVVFFREMSHEPLRRRLEDLLSELVALEGPAREPLEGALKELKALSRELAGPGVASPGMRELAERTARTETALENWLAIDDALAGEDYPDAQLLQDRMRVGLARWPRPDELPRRVAELARRVEAYYDSGENPKQRTL
jgi:hypothetical protein